MLTPEGRLDAFYRHLRFRNRGNNSRVKDYSDKQLIHSASEFLKLTTWPDADTPEDLVARLRARWSEKSAKTRARKTKTRIAREASEAQAARQFDLF